MDSLLIAGFVLASCLLGALAGFAYRARCPDSHTSGESKEVIKQGSGLIATMVALVLGLLVASAKTAFDEETAGFRELSTNLIVLDRSLARYGPETRPARDALKANITAVVDHLWPPDGGSARIKLDDEETLKKGAKVYQEIEALNPKTEAQKAIQATALSVSADLTKRRWALTQPPAPLLPSPFLFVLLFWLMVLFASLALPAPRNGTVVATLLICAISLSGAIFLVVDLGEPVTGWIRVSGESLRFALSHMGQ